MWNTQSASAGRYGTRGLKLSADFLSRAMDVEVGRNCAGGDEEDHMSESDAAEEADDDEYSAGEGKCLSTRCFLTRRFTCQCFTRLQRVRAAGKKGRAAAAPGAMAARSSSAPRPVVPVAAAVGPGSSFRTGMTGEKVAMRSGRLVTVTFNKVSSVLRCGFNPPAVANARFPS
jgi:hypothetical protein